MNGNSPLLLLDFRRKKVFHGFNPDSGRVESVESGNLDDVVGFFDRRLVGLMPAQHVNVAIIFSDDFIEVWIGGKKIRFNEADKDVCFVRSGVVPFVHEFVARKGDEIIFNSRYWWTDLAESGFKTKDIFTYLADELACSGDSVRSFLTNWKMRRLAKGQKSMAQMSSEIAG